MLLGERFELLLQARVDRQSDLPGLAVGGDRLLGRMRGEGGEGAAQGRDRLGVGGVGLSGVG